MTLSVSPLPAPFGVRVQLFSQSPVPVLRVHGDAVNLPGLRKVFLQRKEGQDLVLKLQHHHVPKLHQLGNEYE